MVLSEMLSILIPTTKFLDTCTSWMTASLGLVSLSSGSCWSDDSIQGWMFQGTLFHSLWLWSKSLLGQDSFLDEFVKYTFLNES